MEKIKIISENMALFYDASNGHHGIKATKDIPLHSIIISFFVKEYLTIPTYLSVQIADNQHIHLDPDVLQYLNHSCEPSIFLDTQYNQLIAIKTIQAGEDITFFYPSTEWEMTQPFNCFCRAINCLNTIQGARYLSKDIINRYQFNSHIKNKLSL